MKNCVRFALVALLVSVGIFLYLTQHYYQIKFGFAAGQSICNINATFDCDAVSASTYASFLGVPVSLWGMASSTILFLMVLLGWLEWTENPERLRRASVFLAGTSVLASVAMGVISLTQLHNYCLFCISLYALSLLIFFLLLPTLSEPFWSNFGSDIVSLFTQSRGILAGFIAIPVIAFLGQRIFMQNFGPDKVQALVNESMRAWQQAPAQNFTAKPTLVAGPPAEAAKMTLKEFADFRCTHCKHASYTLDAFVKAHPDVRFEFYTFPLDGCKTDLPGSGLSCLLAKADYCAQKEGKGWDLHHLLYEIQPHVDQLSSVSELSDYLAQQVPKVGLDWKALQPCLNDPATSDAIMDQIKQGELVNIQGTPTIFANGKDLEAGQIIPVLEAVREKIISEKD